MAFEGFCYKPVAGVVAVPAAWQVGEAAHQPARYRATRVRPVQHPRKRDAIPPLLQWPLFIVLHDATLCDLERSPAPTGQVRGEVHVYLMYVDESGDCGLVGSPTRYFVLSGLVIHESHWQVVLERLVAFRRRMRGLYGFRLREELHASMLINRPGGLSRIKKHDRLAILRGLVDEVASMRGMVSLINVVVDKQGKTGGYDVFEMAWRALIQRFENTISASSFPVAGDDGDRGMLFPDHSDDKKLGKLLRQMRHYNPVPHHPAYGIGYRNLPLSRVIEDPNYRVSEDSYLVQAVDVLAFVLHQWLAPNSYMKRKSANNYFRRLEPVVCRQASGRGPLGIVAL